MFEKTFLVRLYQHMRKHYRLYSFTANSMIALAIAGLALLGILNTVLTVKVLVTWGLVFAIIYGVGKWLDQEVDDLDKMRNYECEGYTINVNGRIVSNQNEVNHRTTDSSDDTTG